MVTTEINGQLEKRAGLIAEAGKLVYAAKQAGRELTAEEGQQFDKLHEAAADIKANVEAAKARAEIAYQRQQRQDQADAEMRESRGRAAGTAKPGADMDREKAAGPITFRGRGMKLPAGSAVARRATAEYKSAFGDYLGTGRVSADLQADQADKGGYLVPTEFSNEIVKTLDNIFWFRQKANVLPATLADSVSFPRRTGRMNNFNWGAELTAPTKDTGLAFGQLTLSPGWMCGEVDVSNSLLASGIVDVEGFVMDEIVYAGMELEEYAFLQGDGVRKPLGLFTPHADGVPTSRDVAAAAISTDMLYDAKFMLRDVYLRSPSIAWIAGRQFTKAVAKLKNSQNDPLWVPSYRDGEPDRLIGIPTTTSEYVPLGSTTTNGVSTGFASGDYVGVLGDLRNYDVLDGLDMGVQRLVEIGARNNQTVFIVRRKVTGAARHAEAFVRLKLS